MKKIVIVGAGHRCYNAFAKKLSEEYSDKIVEHYTARDKKHGKSLKSNKSI